MIKFFSAILAQSFFCPLLSPFSSDLAFPDLVGFVCLLCFIYSHKPESAAKWSSTPSFGRASTSCRDDDLAGCFFPPTHHTLPAMMEWYPPFHHIQCTPDNQTILHRYKVLQGQDRDCEKKMCFVHRSVGTGCHASISFT